MVYDLFIQIVTLAMNPLFTGVTQYYQAFCILRQTIETAHLMCVRTVSELSYSTCGLHRRERVFCRCTLVILTGIQEQVRLCYLSTSSVFGGIGAGDEGAALR